MRGAGEAGWLPVYFKRARRMYPYIDIGAIHLGTFGLMLWLAAVAGTVVLHRNFQRNGVDGDALSVVALVVIAGVLGAKTWHELQNVDDLRAAMRMIVAAGMGASGGCAGAISALVSGGVCVVRRDAGRDCDADVAGEGDALQGRGGRNSGQAGWRGADAGSGGSGGGDWLWRGADWVPHEW